MLCLLAYTLNQLNWSTGVKHVPHPYSTRDIMNLPETMRALVLSGAGFEHLSIQTVAMPEPTAKQLLVRVDAAGICTSLIKLTEQGPKHSYMHGWDTSKHPVILGDEGSVTVVKVGTDLSENYQLGDRFVVQPAVDISPINHRERYNNVAAIKKVAAGHTLAGHLAEYMLIPEEILQAGCLLPIPSESIPFAHAAMSEPISCCLSGQEHHIHLIQEKPTSERKTHKGLKANGLTVILGAGAMGRMHVDIAMSYKPKTILVTDFLDQRLERTKALFTQKAMAAGINLVCLNGSQDVLAAIQDLSNHEGADDVIVAVGSAAAIEHAQHYVARYGVLNLFGGLKKGEDLISLDTSIVHYKEINVTGSSGGSPWDIAQTLELMAENQIEASAHITRVGDLDHSIDLIQMIKNRELDGKAVVYPHKRSSEILSVDAWSAQDEQDYLST